MHAQARAAIASVARATSLGHGTPGRSGTNSESESRARHFGPPKPVRPGPRPGFAR